MLKLDIPRRREYAWRKRGRRKGYETSRRRQREAVKLLKTIRTKKVSRKQGK
jgi:hypothetical protein